jgi:hypothetical protein
MRHHRLAAALAALFAAVGPVRGEATFAPVPPCAGDAIPAITRLGEQPAILLRHAGDLPEGWAPAACSELPAPPGATFVAVAGSFRHRGDALALLGRLGAVSAQTAMRYWSAGDGAWRDLLADASALSGPDPRKRRPDFKVEEMRAGDRLYLLYDDTAKPGPVVFATEVRESGPDGFLVLSRNASPVRLLGMSIAAPGDVSSMLSVQRVGGDEFAYYALYTIALAPLAAAMIPDDDHTNRAVAAFRFLAAVPSDSGALAASEQLGPTLRQPAGGDDFD